MLSALNINKILEEKIFYASFSFFLCIVDMCMYIYVFFKRAIGV